MDRELESAIVRALVVARECLGQAGGAINEGQFSRELAVSMSRHAASSAAEVLIALDGKRRELAAHVEQVLDHATLDLQAIGGMASMAIMFDLEPKSARQLAQALMFMAESATESLASAERGLRTA